MLLVFLMRQTFEKIVAATGIKCLARNTRIVERREALGAAIDQLRRQFTSQAEESERLRLSAELNTTIDLFQSLNAEFLRLEQNLEDYRAPRKMPASHIITQISFCS